MAAEEIKKISVIIVAFKNGDVLKNALDKLYRYNDIGDDIEVIVVDNSPENEEVYDSVCKSDFQTCKYIKAQNKGFGAGNNLGVKEASGEILAFINPDVYLVEPIFEDVYSFFQDDKNLMMLGCQVLDKNGKKTYSYFFDYEHSLAEKILTRLFNKTGHYDQRRMFTSGCNLFIRRSAFLNAGQFDEKLFMYYEEADIRRRIQLTHPGCCVAFDRKHSIMHLGGSLLFSENRFRMHKESTIYFGKKYNLDYKQKLRYEYRFNRFKYAVLSVLKNKAEIEDLRKEILCFEKYYSEYIH